MSAGTGVDVSTGGVGTSDNVASTTDGVAVAAMEGVGLTAGVVLVVGGGPVYT